MNPSFGRHDTGTVGPADAGTSRRAFLGAVAAGLLAAACSPWPTQGPLGRFAPYLRPMLPEDWESRGLSGRGVRVAVIDTGFGRADTLPTTRGLRILATHDAVDPARTDFFVDRARHGTEMLEGIGGRNDDFVHGLAHGADYLLVRGEDQFTETTDDEQRAIRAIHWAVSQGAQILSISLGYATFSDHSPYRNTHLDGATSAVSRALAEVLRQDPGLVAVVSAGNEGASDWRFVTFPGDVPDALTVGALQPDGVTPRRTSGRGAPYVPWTKPDLVLPTGLGASSLATAALAGLVACLRERFPGADRAALVRALRASGSFAHAPRRDLGFGIPSAEAAIRGLGAGRN